MVGPGMVGMLGLPGPGVGNVGSGGRGRTDSMVLGGKRNDPSGTAGNRGLRESNVLGPTAAGGTAGMVRAGGVGTIGLGSKPGLGGSIRGILG